MRVSECVRVSKVNHGSVGEIRCECRRCKMGVSEEYDGGCQEYMRVSLSQECRRNMMGSVCEKL